MERITGKHLQAVVDRINRICGTPPKPYEKGEDGMIKPCANNYHLDFAYGGVMLAKMSSQEGCTGITCPLGQAHITKRELYNQLQAFISGLEVQK